MEESVPPCGDSPDVHLHATLLLLGHCPRHTLWHSDKHKTCHSSLPYTPSHPPTPIFLQGISVLRKAWYSSIKSAMGSSKGVAKVEACGNCGNHLHSIGRAGALVATGLPTS